MKNTLLYIVLFYLLKTPAAQAQPSAQNGGVARRFTLPETIELALSASTAAKQAATNKTGSYWQYRTFKADYRPHLTLSGTLPDFSRSIIPVIQPDGTTDFRAVSISNSDLSLSLSQAVGLTGGQFFVSSQSQRFDDFNQGVRRYNSFPAIIGFRQPIFGYNSLGWAKKVEPLRFRESERQFIEDRENIATTATQRFFEVLLQQVNYEIASKNVENNQALFRVAEEKHRLGRLSRNELLQLKLSLMNAQMAQAQASTELKTVAMQFSAYVGLMRGEQVAVQAPEAVPALQVEEQLALEQARLNRKERFQFERRVLQARQQVAQARGKGGFNADLYATFGLTKSANNFSESYAQPENQQQVTLGFSVPIVDWGRQKASVKTAEANLQLTQYTVEQEQTAFEQNVYTQVNQIELLKERLHITASADSIAQERYDITKATFLVGRISITDLNIALQEKDQARRAYITALQDFWVAYYKLRALTLYDFERRQSLLAEK
ncbi:TolC family protein [Rufibacter sediminis]|uniref:TolC family protein n=1 Tax=Rufibacter sediminis TaxID=2762756 RepID=A0ABR6VVF5_9BACT|nr:TolC family protein [Rufibacter sediminis]MBC3540591.1 TolC family protein [Rufibacter sediminis]